MSQSVIQTDAIPSQRIKVANPEVIPACPSWCVLPSGHGYDVEIPGVEIGRVHLALPSNSDANIEASESQTPDGQVTVSEPKLYIYPSDETSADDARQLAWTLMKAAAKLDEINGVEPASLVRIVRGGVEMCALLVKDGVTGIYMDENQITEAGASALSDVLNAAIHGRSGNVRQDISTTN